MIDLATTSKTHVTIEECAEILRKSRRTIYYWIANGKIDASHTPLGQRIPVAELRRLANYLKDHTFLQVAHPAVESVRALSVQASANLD